MPRARPCLFIDGPEGVARLRRRAESEPFAPRADLIVGHAERALSAEFVTLAPVPDAITPQTPRTNDIACARLAGERATTLAMAHLLTGRGEFADRAVAEIRHAIEVWDRWVDWAHRANACDLMAATITLGAGIAYDWLGGAIGPDDRAAIQDGLARRAFVPFLDDIRRGSWWSVERGFAVGVSPVNNWNAWINGGVGVAALGLADELGEAADALAAARRNIQLFVRYIPDDGGNEEGSGYWAAGMRYAIMLFEALRLARGEDDGFFALGAVRRTGYFPIWMSPGGAPMTFGDAASTGADPAAYYILAERFANPDFAWFPPHGTPDRGATAAEAIWALLYPPPPGEPAFAWPRAHHWSSIDWAYLSSGWPDPDVYLSFKNGDLGVSHSQLDANTFQLRAFGEKLAIDLGAPHYTPGYFSPARWQMYAVGTEGHNGVLINHQGQRPYTSGRIIDFRCGDGVASLTGAAEDAYDSYVRRARRHVVLLRNRYFVMLDEIAADRPVLLTWLLHTFGRIDAGQGEARLIGERANLKVLWTGERLDPSVLDNPGRWDPPERVLRLFSPRSQADWLLATLLYPSRGTEDPPLSLSAERQANRLLLGVTHPEGTDALTFIRGEDGWRLAPGAAG